MALVYKQARSIIDERTTNVCLDVHGVIVAVDAEFKTLAGDFLAPPFHVHCRTVVVPAVSGYIGTARREANSELVRRRKARRRKGPKGLGEGFPPPVGSNLPVGHSRSM